MAKKSKSPDKNPTPNESKDDNATTTSISPNSSNIFNKLFGEAPELDPKPFNSIFSSNNPFRRKPSEIRNTQKTQTLGSASDELNRNPRNGGETSDVEGKKRKGIKEKSEKSDVGLMESEDVIKGKKLKKMGLKDGNENPNLDLGFENKKEKKKRKRDELEREYEEKMYGVGEQEEEEEEKREKAAVGKKRKAVDDVTEMAVSEGYDDEGKLLRTVFVGNLPLKVKKKVLLKEFSKFGEVESVRIRSVPTLDSKKPKKVLVMHGKINEAVDSVHAYIVFKTEQSAEASLAHNMAVIGGNHIRVDRACPPRKKLKGDDAALYDNKRTIFVGNLPFDVKDEELYQLFCSIKKLESSVEAVRVIRDRHTSVGKGIAYVLFKTREAANLVVKRHHNLKLRDREIRISYAKSISTPSKRKNPFVSQSDNSPSKKFAFTTPNSSDKEKVKGPASYQGLRATKSGNTKKTPSKSAMYEPLISRSGSFAGKKKTKERTKKRPAVAARKAKAMAINTSGGGHGSGPGSGVGKKRKMDNRTPRSSHMKKKAKKFK